MAHVTFYVGYTRPTRHHCPRQRFHKRRALEIFEEQSLTPCDSRIWVQGNPGYT